MREIIKHLIGGMAFILAGFAILLYSLMAAGGVQYLLSFDGSSYLDLRTYLLFVYILIMPGLFPIVLTFCFLLAKKTENLRGIGLILVILSAIFHYYIVVLALAAHVTLHILYIEPILSIAVLFWYSKYKPTDSKNSTTTS